MLIVQVTDNTGELQIKIYLFIAFERCLFRCLQLQFTLNFQIQISLDREGTWIRISPCHPTLGARSSRQHPRRRIAGTLQEWGRHRQQGAELESPGDR